MVYRKNSLAAFDAIEGKTKKLVILDLDNTLWGGIIGEVGWEKIRFGGHDPVGEAYLEFQKALKDLMNRGIQLAVVSKNEESVALEALAKHPEMQIRIDDLVAWRINWSDKAQNIIDIVNEVNVGMDSVVFFDDSITERERVKEALPQILVPELPSNPFNLRDFLWGMSCFDSIALSQEDRVRAQNSKLDRKRRSSKQSCSSLDEWLTELNTLVTVDPLSDSNISRIVQLFNKTNQFNLSTRRLSEKELLHWVNVKERCVLGFRVEDRFGDSGLVGILSLDGSTGEIVDFILSCRVMGRQIEKTMLHIASIKAQELGLERIFAKYARTERNKPCLDFWLHESGFEKMESDMFAWDCKEVYDLPPSIKMKNHGK